MRFRSSVHHGAHLNSTKPKNSVVSLCSVIFSILCADVVEIALLLKKMMFLLY